MGTEGLDVHFFLIVTMLVNILHKFPHSYHLINLTYSETTRNLNLPQKFINNSIFSTRQDKWYTTYLRSDNLNEEPLKIGPDTDNP